MTVYVTVRLPENCNNVQTQASVNITVKIFKYMLSM